MVAVVDEIKKGALIKVFYNDLQTSVTFKEGIFQNVNKGFLILKSENIIHIPRGRIVRVEEVSK